MGKNRNVILYCLSGLVFLCCFYFGLLLAEHKPLWNDEIYTQISSISSRSYGYYFFGHVGEGNNCPLFYSLQKFICDVLQYQTPDLWNQHNTFDRLILRLNPVFFVSASIMCIFFYFSRFYSIFAGVYSLLIAVSTIMLWDHWAEARPYALWMFLTTVQSLLFLYLFRRKEVDRRAWIGLTVTHILLGLTVIFSVAQITIVSGLLWIFREKKWQKYILSAFIPICVAVFYYTQAPHYQFWFDLTPEQLIRDCFSRERIYILFMFTFFLGTYYVASKTGFPKSFPNKSLLEGSPCFFLAVLMILAAISLLVLLKWIASPVGQGFPIPGRYFAYLTPIGIISTTLLSITIFRSLAGNRLVQMLLLTGMGYLIIHRFIKVIPHIKKVYAPMFL